MIIITVPASGKRIPGRSLKKQLQFECSWRRRLSLACLLALSVLFVLPQDSSALWPFSAKEKEPYVAKVGGIVVSKKEFLERIDTLHTSKRVGKALSTSFSTDVLNFRRFLDELIDEKLMVMEVEALSLHEDSAFVIALDNFVLNLSLVRLRQDEISNKVKVDEAELEEYRQKLLEGEGEGAKADSDDLESIDSQAQMYHGVGTDKTRTDFLILKTAEREKEYFSELRRKARVKVDKEAFLAISFEMKNPEKSEVATLFGEPIYALDVLRLTTRDRLEDEGVRDEALENALLHRLLDREALRRGYEKEPELKKKIERFRTTRLIDFFSKRVVAPMVSVSDEDARKHYEANPDKYSEPDMLNLRIMVVRSLAHAESIIQELKDGADFGFLAKANSKDFSAKKGGDIGWVPSSKLPAEVVFAVKDAKGGDILGPFLFEYGATIFSFNGIKEGKLKPFESVSGDIHRTLWRTKRDATHKRYIQKLRETVPIEINEEEIQGIG